MSEIRANVERLFSEWNERKLRFLPDGVVDHLIDCGVSVVETKYGIGPEGGGFVQAVVSNNLMEAFGRADSINQEYMGFYAYVLYNYQHVLRP